MLTQEYAQFFKRDAANLAQNKRFLVTRENTAKKYEKQKVGLFQKKERLFFQQDEYKWGLDPGEAKEVEVEQLKADKQRAFEFMLREESNRLLETQLWYGHLNVRLKDQLDTHMLISNTTYLDNQAALLLLLAQLNHLGAQKISSRHALDQQLTQRLTEHKCARMARHFNQPQEPTVLLE